MTSPEFYQPRWQVPENVKALITTRCGGVSSPPFDSLNMALHVDDEPSAVLKNRHLLAHALTHNPEGDRDAPAVTNWQWLEQVHSNRVLRVTSPQPALVADGLITSEPGLACCVLTADCLSVFLAARDGTEIAVVHAGWRGLATGIVSQAVQQMSTPAPKLTAWLGPAIGPCHFEVGVEVRETFVSNNSAAAACFSPVAGSQKFMANLYDLAILDLSLAGVEDVAGGGECTYCQKDKYYSYRRSGKTGRQLSMIYLQP